MELDSITASANISIVLSLAWHCPALNMNMANPHFHWWKLPSSHLHSEIEFFMNHGEQSQGRVKMQLPAKHDQS